MMCDYVIVFIGMIEDEKQAFQILHHVKDHRERFKSSKLYQKTLPFDRIQKSTSTSTRNEENLNHPQFFSFPEKGKQRDLDPNHHVHISEMDVPSSSSITFKRTLFQTNFQITDYFKPINSSHEI
jgi:hypothetical protein